MALSLHDVALLEHGPTISMSVDAGQTLCVVGPAASGKSKMLRILSAQIPPDRGVVGIPEGVTIPSPCNRKLRPQDLSHRKGVNQAVLATEVLSQLGLWDVRQTPISELSEPVVVACDLVETLMGSGGLIVLDGHLDRLDPWTRVGALRLIRDRCSQGAVCVVATNQLELVTQFDHLLVLKDHQPIYAGSIASLVSTRGQRSVTIESQHNTGVRALVAPLLVAVNRTSSGYELKPGPGQEHTAKLLREGYGDVKYVVSDEKSLAEIIYGMIA